MAGKICSQQHGFVRGRSVVSNLLIYSDLISDALDSSLQVDVLYTDFAKAFDSVSHRCLINKLLDLGLDGHFVTWVYSYLEGHSQRVRLQGFISEPIEVTSGVPQGSHLGPILFLLFVNDLVSGLKFVKGLLYADDFKAYEIVRSINDAILFQADLDYLSQWSYANGLDFNLSKCKILSFSKGRSPICFDYSLYCTQLERVDIISGIWVSYSVLILVFLVMWIW